MQLRDGHWPLELTPPQAKWSSTTGREAQLMCLDLRSSSSGRKARPLIAYIVSETLAPILRKSLSVDQIFVSAGCSLTPSVGR